MIRRPAARIPPELHALIKHAAEISGPAITDFVVEAETSAAQRAVEQSNAALERALVRRPQLLREE